MLASAFLARDAASSPLEAIIAATIVGLFAATLAIVMAHDLMTFLTSAIRRIMPSLMRIVDRES
jgi:hypothetical protein